MPPRNPLGVVSGVLKSPCASSHSTRTSGHVAHDGLEASSCRSSSPTTSAPGSAPAASMSSTWPPASSRQPRESRRSSSQTATRGSPEEPTRRASGSSASAERLRAARAAGRAVRRPAAQRRDAQRPGPHRLPLLEERLARPPGCRRSRTRARAARAGTRSRRRSAHVLLAVHRVLAQPHQQRRLGRQPARPVGDRGVELLGRHDLVDDPDPLGLVRVDLLAQQQQLVGLLAPDVAVDQRHDHEREDPDVDLGRAEAGALLGDDQVARQREPERAGEHVAVGGAQRRLAELADQVEQAREAVGGEVLVDQRRVGGERRRGRRRRRRPSRGWRSARRSGRRRRRARRSSAAIRSSSSCVRERVAGLGPVHGDRRDAGRRRRS